MVDLRPTLPSLAGLPAPEVCQGVDLVPWLRGEVEACPSQPAMIHQRALRHDGYKLIRERDGLRLYDLGADPRERVDLAGLPEMKEQRLVLNRKLWRQIGADKEIRRANAGPPVGDAPLTDKKTAKMLEDLGYVQ